MQRSLTIRKKMPFRMGSAMGKGVCTFIGCGRDVHCKGLCEGHYTQNRRGQRLRALRPTSPVERFWSRVDTTGACWVWRGKLTASGYGRIKVHGYEVPAHRFAYQQAHGHIPDGLVIDHMCWNRACVNPAHLRLATYSQNGQNRKGLPRNNMSGYRGVYLDKERGLWRAHPQLDGRHHHLGHFDTAEAAHEAVSSWRREHMPYSIQDQGVSN
jgi:hypothetical protein